MARHLCLSRNLNLGAQDVRWTSVLRGPERSVDQRTCYIADPEGNLIEIGSWNKPYEEKDIIAI